MRVNLSLCVVLSHTWQLEEAMMPTLIMLTQSLIFRRARRYVFGYASQNMVKHNKRWRRKVGEKLR